MHSAEEMNCGDTRYTIDPGLTEAQAKEIATRLVRTYEAKAIGFAEGSELFRPAHLEGFYVLAFCGVRRDGPRFVIVDGIYKFMGSMICDDAAGFGIAYDLRNRTFGKMRFGVSSCIPPNQKPPKSN
ncbi:MAG TPA: hypothetical protein VHZ78_06750 [Rhizomicrobium sp.]|nr:hypothetical protein [Rhizomicrobium sp.]